MKRTVTFTAHQITSILLEHVSKNQKAFVVTVDAADHVAAMWNIHPVASDNTISLTFSESATDNVKGGE